MLEDRYGNLLTTSSSEARDHYIEGVDATLGAGPNAQAALLSAIDADPSFALAHAALARAVQIVGSGNQATSGLANDASTHISRASELTDGITHREQSHLAIIDLLVKGKSDAAFGAIVAHVAEYPRDALMVQPCSSVFGLIGFSGRVGREAEMLAFMSSLAPHYDEDWWFDSLLAFAQVETGQTEKARKNVERALQKNPRNANGAHILAHVYYEAGQRDDGYRFLSDWCKTYDRRGPLHSHLYWHVALWALEAGDIDNAWSIAEDYFRPGKTESPPVNVMTDMASFLLRAEMGGAQRRSDLWSEVSEYAMENFPNTGTAFVDVHAALAHAMSGNDEALKRIVADAKGPAANVVKSMSEAFREFANENWAESVQLMVPVMSEHERLGGSRAQRDLVEFTMVNAMLKANRAEEAQRLLAMRRPMKVPFQSAVGL